MTQQLSTRGRVERATRTGLRRTVGRGATALATVATLGFAFGAAWEDDVVIAAPVGGSGTVAAATAVETGEVAFALDDSLTGRSRKLRARFLTPEKSESFPFLRQLLGDAIRTPGAYAVDSAAAGRPFTFITMLPFAAKVNGRIGGYRIGAWPNERGARLAGKYANPAGFIQVTRDNQATPVSEHFRLRDFLTKDQVNVWPKYLVLDPELVDKLELVLDDLRARGYDARRLHVMSGFRTPQYNVGGGDPRGRADLSRHQYGDAADVWVENGAGRMADLNRDGRVDTRDAAIVAESAERVERAHPELVGGVGIYKATSAHGPFVHVDTRGKRARWGHV